MHYEYSGIQWLYTSRVGSPFTHLFCKKINVFFKGEVKVNFCVAVMKTYQEWHLTKMLRDLCKHCPTNFALTRCSGNGRGTSSKENVILLNTCKMLTVSIPNTSVQGIPTRNLIYFLFLFLWCSVCLCFFEQWDNRCGFISTGPESYNQRTDVKMKVCF